MEQRELIVSPDLAGRRVDQVVSELLGPEFSRSQVQRFLKENRVNLAGKPAKASQKVWGGEALRVEIPDPEPLDIEPEDMDLSILWEDEHLLVVNKPAGLVVHPSPGHGRGTLVHGLLHHTGGLAEVGGKLRPGIVHRLDMDTSGAMVVAKNDQTHRALVGMFAAGRMSKQYLALVYGDPPHKGEIKAGIGRHPVDRKRMSSEGRHTKPAQTRWRVVSRYPQGASLLRVTIATGRTHQIRVHLSEAGFPVVGDKMYGGRREKKGLAGRAGEEAARAGRQLLHAVHLGFTHPVTGEKLWLAAPLPQDFRRVLRTLWEEKHA